MYEFMIKINIIPNFYEITYLMPDENNQNFQNFITKTKGFVFGIKLPHPTGYRLKYASFRLFASSLPQRKPRYTAPNCKWRCHVS